jgi:hypothetical protein
MIEHFLKITEKRSDCEPQRVDFAIVRLGYLVDFYKEKFLVNEKKNNQKKMFRYKTLHKIAIEEYKKGIDRVILLMTQK